MDDTFVNKLIETLPRDLLLDLFDISATRAREAHEAIRDRFGYLNGKNARAAEGQIRFRIMEHGFQEVCELHGGILMEGGVIQGTDLRVFQPFMRFGGSGPGIVLGLASIPARGELPVKNQSRMAGVTLNYQLTPRLALDKHDPQPGDVFILFMVARDRERAGHIEEVAVGAVSSDYEGFLFYEPIETFMSRYAPADRPSDSLPASPEGAQQTVLKLKNTPKVYQPPEVKDNDDTLEEKRK